MKLPEKCAVTNYIIGLRLRDDPELAERAAHSYAKGMARSNKLPKICKQENHDCLISYYRQLAEVGERQLAGFGACYENPIGLTEDDV